MSRDTIEVADLFCGAGGTSQGVLMAANRLQRKLVLLAVNHWQIAIDTHTVNHAEARNLCTGLEEVKPHKLVPGGRLDLLCASPECTHHSVARGGKPMDDQSRSSAWLVLQWAQQLYIGAMIFENVPEWESWGPLGANGKPLKSKRGELFQSFVATLRAMNYKVEWRVLNCADYGSPTTRHRLFMICRRDGKAIRWPEPSHVAPAKKHDPIPMFADTRPTWKTARQIIDWTLPAKSIWGRKKPHADNTLKRIGAGMLKFNGIQIDLVKAVRENLRPYLVVAPGRTLKDADAFLLPHRTFTNMNADSLEDPLRTVTANSADFCLVKPFLMQIDHSSGGGSLRSVDDPVATLVTKENTAACEPFLTVFRGTGVTADVDTPMHTVTASGNHYGVVEPFIVPNFGERLGQQPRTHAVDAPLPAVTSHGAGQLVQPYVVTVNHGDGLNRRTRSVDEPMATVTGSMGEGVAEPFLATVGGATGQSRNPRSIDEPLGTVMTNDRRAIAEPSIVKFYGTAHVSGIDQPVPSVTTKDRFGLMDPELVAVDLDGLVAQGYTVYLLDIHFRMLQPRELARAQGFPDSYKFTGNREEVVKQIGNAVPPDVMNALAYEVLSQSFVPRQGKPQSEVAA